MLRVIFGEEGLNVTGRIDNTSGYFDAEYIRYWGN